MDIMKLILAILILIMALSIFAQTLTPAEQAQARRIQNILIEEEAFESEIEIRLPETAIMPRRETEEIRFTLSFIRQRFIESNRLLY